LTTADLVTRFYYILQMRENCYHSENELDRLKQAGIGDSRSCDTVLLYCLDARELVPQRERARPAKAGGYR
jgi:endonuclease III-like uncharacterized protein